VINQSYRTEVRSVGIEWINV